MSRTRDTADCAQKADAARGAAATSSNPLLCLARAAWWAAVTDQCTGTETSDGLLTNNSKAHSGPRS